jgi:hypothetical protein
MPMAQRSTHLIKRLTRKHITNFKNQNPKPSDFSVNFLLNYSKALSITKLSNGVYAELVLN